MSDAEQDPISQAIKVVDRRRFTAEGRVKPGAGELSENRRRSAPPAPVPSAAAVQEPGEARMAGQAQPPQAAAPMGGPQGAGPGQEPEPEPRLEFLPFVASLATNALAALGVLPEGHGGGMPRDPNVAREYIDIIIMLERRTRGNLSPDEAKTMAQLVADLRVQFVEATRQVQPARGAMPPPGYGRPPG